MSGSSFKNNCFTMFKNCFLTFVASPRFLSTLSRVLRRNIVFIKLNRNTRNAVLFLQYILQLSPEVYVTIWLIFTELRSGEVNFLIIKQQHRGGILAVLFVKRSIVVSRMLRSHIYIDYCSI